MDRLSNDEFFARLVELFDSRKGKDHGSIFLTQKRLSHNQPVPAAADEATTITADTVNLPDLHPPRPLPVLIRATDGNSRPKSKSADGQWQKRKGKRERVKLSTVVEADALPAFFERYADVCKAGMTTLKPRDRSKRKGKAKKKKAGAGGS